MGTRCLTVFINEEDEEIAVMYRQMNGYPEKHGRDLVEFLKDIIIVNGLSIGEEKKIANGMHCLAAQIVSEFKNEAGGIYLYPAGTRDCGENYIYYISGKIDEKPRIKIYACYEEEEIANDYSDKLVINS